MTSPKAALIVVHRWLGVASCLLFAVWFVSGIGIMYWDFPSVTLAHRLAHAPAIDPSLIRLSPAEAYATLGLPQPPDHTRLNTFDGRPVYRFQTGGADSIVYADTGERQRDVSSELMGRVAGAWTRKPVSEARVEPVRDVDQWTLQVSRSARPVWKYRWPDGEEVYVSSVTGEVVQHTTPASRWGAYAGAIPHWLYFTPLRKDGPMWSRVVIWSSAIGAVTALFGIVLGTWMYSPSKPYRHNGAPSGIPYRGQKRWHMILGLIFGSGAVTWAFSGMLSMDPFPLRRGPAREGDATASKVVAAFRSHAPIATFMPKSPRDALIAMAGSSVVDVEFTMLDGEPFYLVTLASGETRVIPLTGQPEPAFPAEKIIDVVKAAAGPAGIADLRVLERYDRYYLDRRRRYPLPVVLAKLTDAGQTRLYIDPKTARIVGNYNGGDWMARWLYHGLHSLDFPWLYNYRPLWDGVMITFMAGGAALSVTSLILAWRVIRG